jgi:hypothetical protein
MCSDGLQKVSACKFVYPPPSSFNGISFRFLTFVVVFVSCTLSTVCRRPFVDMWSMPQITLEDKIKGMFLSIWRDVQVNVQQSLKETSRGKGFNTYKGGLLRGSQIFNERFITAWGKDGYRDYLDPTGQVQPSATDAV